MRGGARRRFERALRAARVLYHVENVDSQALATEVARLVHVLRGCPLLVTGRVPGLGAGAGMLVGHGVQHGTAALGLTVAAGMLFALAAWSRSPAR